MMADDLRLVPASARQRVSLLCRSNGFNVEDVYTRESHIIHIPGCTRLGTMHCRIKLDALCAFSKYHVVSNGRSAAAPE